MSVFSQLNIPADCLPTSVRQLRFMNAHEVYVFPNALSGLMNIQSIVFENIAILLLQTNDPTPGLNQGQLSIVMDRINRITLDAGSFSHWNRKALNISITNISVLRIGAGAIASSSNSSNVTLENIANGFFYPGTFATTLRRLALKNVTTRSPCRNNTFGGGIEELSLTEVRLGNIQEDCFLADQTWDSLVVRSSRLGDVPERGLYGTIRHVHIDQTVFGRIHKNGFDLDVMSFSVNESSMGTMDSNALNVRATFGISIQRFSITTARENAFYGLNASQGVKLSQLTVATADSGSLRVFDVKSVMLQHLLIRSQCECDIQEQVGQLFLEGKPQGTLTEQEDARLFESAYENIQCLHNRAALSLREYHCSNCRPRLNLTACDKSSDVDQPSDTSAVGSWMPAVASLGCLLLALAIITLVVLYSRQQVSRQTPSPSPMIPVMEMSRPMQDLPQKEEQRYTQSPPAQQANRGIPDEHP